MPYVKKALLFIKTLKEEGIDDVYIGSSSLQAPAVQEAPKLSKKAAAAAVSNAESPKEALVALRQVVLPCTLCSELASTRKSVVFGAGNSTAKLMFVGEAPGADEDEQGLPFVGRAGQLLTKIIESIGLKREEVFIANTLKCRPPGNRKPQPDEIKNCSPFLKKQIEIINPKIICALGASAAQTLLETEISISQLRGKFYHRGSYKLIATYHPAYLLRNPGDKRLVWEDMKKIKKELDSIHS